MLRKFVLPCLAAALFAQAGAACVVATHDLAYARKCDAVVVLGEGRMLAAGAPAEALTDAINYKLMKAGA